MKIDESQGRGWPINDIGGLAREVPEVDPRRYFDEQARLAYEEALVKWPVLARLMGLVGDADAPEPRDEDIGASERPLPPGSSR
jgi:hypothetical protein